MTQEELVAFAIKYAGRVCSGYLSNGGSVVRTGRVIAYCENDGTVSIEWTDSDYLDPPMIKMMQELSQFTYVVGDPRNSHSADNIWLVELTDDEHRHLEQLRQDVLSWEP